MKDFVQKELTVCVQRDVSLPTAHCHTPFIKICSSCCNSMTITKRHVYIVYIVRAECLFIIITYNLEDVIFFCIVFFLCLWF